MRGKWRKLCTGERQIVFDDERYLFVQNSFLNLEGMSDGSITVIDLNTDQVVGNIHTLKAAGFNPTASCRCRITFKRAGCARARNSAEGKGRAGRRPAGSGSLSAYCFTTKWPRRFC